MSRNTKILNQLSRFFRDEGGNYAMMMGIVAFPLVGATALAVDYSYIERERTTVQAALDAAALAASKEFASGVNEAAFKTYAKDFFETNLPPAIDKSKITMTASIQSEVKQGNGGSPVTEKSVRLDATIKYTPFMATVLGMQQIESDLVSQVAMGNLTVEIALVIDNSGSMSSNSRMTRAKDTSKQLVDQIFAAGAISNKEDPVKFSLVPFAASVNIGASNWNKPWMDTKGWAPIHNENLDWSTYYTTRQMNIRTVNTTDGRSYKVAREKQANGSWTYKSRFDVYDMLDVDWAGCVEMRPWPHNVQDTVLDTSSNTAALDNQIINGNVGANFDALFVPMFAPSEPMSVYMEVDNKGKFKSKTDWYNYGNDYTNDWRNGQNQVFASTSNDRQSNQNVRQDWIFRYQNNYKSSGIAGSYFGPNVSCTTKPLTPLTTNKSTIKNAIDAMGPDGNTNVHEGIAWGWRTLSPAEPFTGGRERTDIDNRKYLIVLTDGNNTYSTNSTPNETTYAAWGYGKHDRIEGGLSNADRPNLYKNASINSFEQKMNVHTLQTCENAKKDGVTVFSIAFDVANGSSVKQLLEACAGSGLDQSGSKIVNSGQFYFDVSGNQIEAAMASIASQISEMRITR